MTFKQLIPKVESLGRFHLRVFYTGVIRIEACREKDLLPCPLVKFGVETPTLPSPSQGTNHPWQGEAPFYLTSGVSPADFFGGGIEFEGFGSGFPLGERPFLSRCCAPGVVATEEQALAVGHLESGFEE